ncbi:MAG: tyrosine--tRNA ligase [Rickettsiales bacterium]|jgi:tyrosyl-tRNA synthetase|nr:tyrosine--tRNA ligase [Rickettsiales bacterium]
MTQKLFDMLQERGFVKDMTHPEQIKNALNGSRKITFYLGIDPTADSLHIGHFFALRMFRHLQNAGHNGILVIGGATALVGDPTGKSDMRKMLTKEEVAHNIEEVKTLARRFVLPNTEIVDNAEWINKFTYVDFMRLVCVHFNVNTMLASEAYSRRRENGGLTFLEMGYMPMQAYDFIHLNESRGCTFQIGGSDQWGNIVAGTELFRKMNIGQSGGKSEIYGLTAPLLMTVDGKKMGKTEKGTLWVARDKTTPFDFYQYFYNMPDENTGLLLSLFTDIPIPEIVAMCTSDIVAAKKRMAYETTKLIHGEELAVEAVAAAMALFGGGANAAAIPSTELKMAGNMNVVDLIVAAGLVPSKSEARRAIEQGGLIVAGEKITDPRATMSPATGESILLQKGKKTFLKVVIK